MFVMTIDQRGSRHAPDRVPALIAELPAVPGVLRGPERTVGDEVQAVLDDPDAVVELALHLLRLGEWSVGIGAGPVDEPLPASPREGRGEAFVLARSAVDAAKSRQRQVPLAVRGADPVAAADAEAVLTLLGAVLARRTPAGWRAVDESGPAGDRNQDAVAARLGITQQAVSERLRTALRAEEVAVRPAAARLLTAAAG
jgi:hypothetical protein